MYSTRIVTISLLVGCLFAACQSGQNAQSIGRSDRQGRAGYYYGLHSSYSYNLPPQEIDKMIARGKPIIDALVRDGVPVTDFLMDISLSFFHSRDR